MKQEQLYNKLCNEAVSCIEAIIEPIAKVQAIASILPFISKDMKVEVDTSIEEIEKEVKKKVEAEKEKLKAESEKGEASLKQSVEFNNNIVTLETEKKEPSSIEEKPLTETSNQENIIDAEEEIIVKENETPDEKNKRLEAVVKKYGNLTLKEFMSQNFVYLNKEFFEMNDFKQLAGEYAARNNMECTDGSVYMHYYMTLADKHNEKVKEDMCEMKISTFIETFYPFMLSLSRIYKFNAQEIQKVLQKMSNNTYKMGLSNVNVNNAEALADALEETYKN